MSSFSNSNSSLSQRGGSLGVASDELSTNAVASSPGDSSETTHNNDNTNAPLSDTVNTNPTATTSTRTDTVLDSTDEQSTNAEVNGPSNTSETTHNYDTEPADTLEDSVTEITADMVAEGADLQGIPWNNLPFSRADYRATRLLSPSRSRDSSNIPSDGPNYPHTEPQRGAELYDFFSNSRDVKCSIVHFQLRNLTWATSKNDVYVMHDGSIVHWNAATKRKTQVLDLSGTQADSVLDAVNLHEQRQVQVSSMIARDDLVIAGGFYGELIAKNMSNGRIIHNGKITDNENAITNAMDIFDSTLMTSNNDRYLRCFDLQTFERINAFHFETPVNHATRQPLGGKMVVVAGDERLVRVIDGDSGEKVSELHGHGHFSFATGWHPNAHIFATGSQDKTCRIWDSRNMSDQVCVLRAHTGAVRSLRFSSCGRYMVMAEPRDYVHIYDVNGGMYDKCQEIDMFGEIAGIALSPQSERLFVGISDRIYSSLLQFDRRESSNVELS